MKIYYNKSFPGQELFGSFQVADIAGIERTKMNDFMKQGLIVKGKIKEPHGKQLRTLYSRLEIYRISLFKQLLDLGVKPSHAKRVAEKLDKSHFNPKETKWIVLAGIKEYEENGVKYFNPEIVEGLKIESLIKVIKNLGTSIVLNICEIVKSVDERIEAIKDK